MKKAPPILLAISGQTQPYIARRYYKDPHRGTRSIATAEFAATESVAYELEEFRRGIYLARTPTDHIPEGAA